MVYDYYLPMDWYICSGVYVDELSAPFRQLRTRLFIATLFLLVVTVIISFFYSGIILAPLKQLIKAMGLAKEGIYDLQIAIKRNDEIGQLSTIYNEMITEIKQHTQALELSNLTLESKVRQRTEQLEKLSNLDGLTGIANRRKMDQYLQMQLNICRREDLPLSVIMLDIDCFKKYNDTYGHPRGDDCLKRIAKGIEAILHRATDLVGRYGGEEFVIVLMNTEKQGAIRVARSIHSMLNALAIEHKTSETADHVTVSMGITTEIDLQDVEMTDLYIMADKALYMAKKNGRNRFEHIDDSRTRP